MFKAFVLLILSLNASLSLATDGNEQTTIETHSSLWLNFDTSDYLPTRRRGKHISEKSLKACKDWIRQAQRNFAANFREPPTCESSGGVWGTQLTFKIPLTLVSRNRYFTSSMNKQKMEACLKWTKDIISKESTDYFWSNCYFADEEDDTETVIGEIKSRLGHAFESKSRLVKHHHTQARNSDVKFIQRVSSTTDMHFPFTFQKSPADPSDPADCENWRKQSLKKFAAHITGIEPCMQAGLACNLSAPPSCTYSLISRMTWKVPRTIYVIERKFPSPGTTSQGLDSCLRWLKEEQEFAPTETIDGKCKILGSERSGGTTIYSIKGSIHQVDLE